MEQEYPDFVNMLPQPEDIDLNTLANGSIMTDVCNAARKGTRLLQAEVLGETHALLCCHHLRQTHCKNVLDSLTGQKCGRRMRRQGCFGMQFPMPVTTRVCQHAVPSRGLRRICGIRM